MECWPSFLGRKVAGDERHRPLVNSPGTLENFEMGAAVHSFQGDEPWKTQ